jgi:hypothetical protein
MSERPTLACDLTVLAPAERERRAGLADRLDGSIVAVQELPAGYALTLDGKRLPPDDLRALVDLERRCCPFLRFEIAPGQASNVLVVTGDEGVKEFLAALLKVAGR